jgi:hypothetical protein
MDNPLGALFGGPAQEDRRQLSAEDRARSHDREMQTTGVAMGDDQVYIEQQDKNSDLLKWQQDLGDELETLKHLLRSEHRVGDQWVAQFETVTLSDGTVKKYLVPALCSESFISKVESQIKPFLSRNLINSNFSEKRILATLHYTMDDINHMMAFTYRENGIRFENYPIVDRLIKNIISPGSFRSVSGWNKKMDTTMSKRIESVYEKGFEQNEKRRTGIFG